MENQNFWLLLKNVKRNKGNTTFYTSKYDLFKLKCILLCFEQRSNAQILNYSTWYLAIVINGKRIAKKVALAEKDELARVEAEKFATQ